jgi:hypothetical protein
MIPEVIIVHQQRYRPSDRRTDYWVMIPEVIIVYQQRYRPSGQFVYHQVDTSVGGL